MLLRARSWPHLLLPARSRNAPDLLPSRCAHRDRERDAVGVAADGLPPRAWPPRTGRALRTTLITRRARPAPLAWARPRRRTLQRWVGRNVIAQYVSRRVGRL